MIEFNETVSIERADDKRFIAEIEALIKHAEQHRLRFMKQYRDREVLTAIIGMLAVVIGGCGFGWFLFMKAQLVKAIASMVVAAAVPLVLQLWSDGPVKDYIKDHKVNFMPRMAKVMGGFKFYPSRGISAKVLPKTGVLPMYDAYKAEDCFMGTYKGIKVILSEARLSMKKRPVFDGLFALLEIPNEVIDGHTIVSADRQMGSQRAGAQWAKFSPVPIKASQNQWNLFEVYSDQPESAKLLIGDKFLKELAEASEVFDNSAVSAVFFRKKYIFLSIPYKKNMFEASSIYMPISTQSHAMACKREIDQILEIIDVFEIYQKHDTTPGTT